MKRITVAIFTLFLCAHVQAQTTELPEDHDALRKLMNDTLTSINDKDYAKAETLMANPFRATVLTQDSFSDFNKLKDYYESLFTRDKLRVKTVRFNATADDLSQIYTGTYAVSSGKTEEFYEMANGQSFTLDGRWTAVTTKQDGQWKILAIHSGVNPIENPIISAIEKASLCLIIATGGISFLGGLLFSWLWRRLRRRKA